MCNILHEEIRERGRTSKKLACTIITFTHDYSLGFFFLVAHMIVLNANRIDYAIKNVVSFIRFSIYSITQYHIREDFFFFHGE